MIGLLAFAALFIVAGILASIAHELAHVLGVWAVGGRVEEVSFSQKYVVYAIDDDTGGLEWVINLAPQSIGLIVAVYWLGINGSPEGWAGIIGAWSWAVFTLWGSREDFTLATDQYVRPQGA